MCADNEFLFYFACFLVFVTGNTGRNKEKQKQKARLKKHGLMLLLINQVLEWKKLRLG